MLSEIMIIVFIDKTWCKTQERITNISKMM